MSDLKNPIEEKLAGEVVGEVAPSAAVGDIIAGLDDMSEDKPMVNEGPTPEQAAVRMAESRGLQKATQVVNYASSLLLEHAKKFGLSTVKTERIADALRISDEFLAMSEDYTAAKISSETEQAIAGINLEASE